MRRKRFLIAFLTCITPLSFVSGQSRADSVAVEVAAAQYMRAHVLDGRRARFIARDGSLAVQPNRDRVWLEAVLGGFRTAKHDVASALVYTDDNCAPGDAAINFKALKIDDGHASMEVTATSHNDIEFYEVELVRSKGTWSVQKWTLTIIGDVAVPDKKPPASDHRHDSGEY